MSVHQISNGSDQGLMLYNGAGVSKINFRQLFVCTGASPSSSWIEFAELWHCTVANPGTGSYTWVKFCVMDKYAPTIALSAYDLTQANSVAPLKIHYTDNPSGGSSRIINVGLHNTTQGLIANQQLAVGGRASPGTFNTSVPSGWVTGDIISSFAEYIDSYGYNGPTLAASSGNLTIL